METSELPAALPPHLPASVVSFDCTDFGGYGPRGYNPNQIAGCIQGIPIKYLTEGEWLGNKNTGSSGSVFVFRDAEAHEVGRAFKPSIGVIPELIRKGLWPAPLHFVLSN